jgi:uracil-DNA glycosylase
VNKLRGQELKAKGVDVIYVPHPSGRTTTWKNEPEKVESSFIAVLAALRR